MGAINDEAANILGWMSIACWIIVYSPQIIENYQLKSGEGLSVLFVIIWLLGDLLNLVGAAMAGLLPTMIILGIYYSACDIILLLQVYYYRWAWAAKEDATLVTERHIPSDAPIQGSTTTETTPLLAQKDASLAKSHRRWTKVVSYAGAVAFVLLVGFLAWFFNKRDNGNSDDGFNGSPREEDIIEWRSQTFGWLSAFLYLASRVPQILKNRQTHCAGLSLALFLFSILGNVTYVASILVKSISRKHLIANASWLVGSGGTVFLDLIVLAQFVYYSQARHASAPLQVHITIEEDES